MTRKFKKADYEKTLDVQIRLRDALPPEHLARFIVEVIAMLDLSRMYAQYGELGAPPIAIKLRRKIDKGKPNEDDKGAIQSPRKASQ